MVEKVAYPHDSDMSIARVIQSEIEESKGGEIVPPGYGS